MFTLTIETGNAAFDDGLGSELARILETLAERLAGEYRKGDADGAVCICATRERAVAELRSLIAGLYHEDDGYRDDMTEDELRRWLDVEYGLTPDIEAFEVLP